MNPDERPQRSAPTALEARWRVLAPPQAVESARALYALTPLWTSGNLSFVDEPYDARREGHWADAARVADYAAALPAGGSRVLDVGPGDGWPALPLTAALPHAQVIGVDPAPLRVAVCRANAARLGLANAMFVVGDGAALPFAAAAFDLATAASSLEEASEPERVFAEIARVLRPGGVLRASYQVWRLPAPRLETVTLVGGVDSLLYTYAVRTQQPPRERRYVLVLPPAGAAAAAHRDALVLAAAAPRAYGETLLTPGSPLGVPLLERLAPFARRSLVVGLRRWTTGWLVEALRGAGFAEVRATMHAGDLARAVARRLIASGDLDAAAPRFAVLTRAFGEAAARAPGESMVTAIR
ncbi:MAG: class I SAM-dependent methyltransferase [Dehalococcoidia bacterium]|nr:class I SAM-dependent methyltransferase [Dehalococcoidia bacterium]